MARISKGILGGVSGTVGNIVGGSWKGIDYVRSRTSGERTVSSEAQKDQRLKFRLIMHFLQPMAPFLGLSFRSLAVKMTGMNAAVSYNLQNAVTGTSPLYTIDYAMALISRGNLPGAAAPVAASTVAGKVAFSWTDNSGVGKALATDSALLVVYWPELQQSAYTIGPANRGNGSGELTVASFSGKEVETWIGFLSANGREAATSVYTGQVTIL